MSRTEMYAAPEDGAFVKVAEFPNSWGGAAYVWSCLCARYLGDESLWLIDRDGGARKCWDLAKDDSPLKDCERQTLRATFDLALVERKNFRRLAGLFRAFVANHPPGGRACSLPEQAELLDRLSGDDHGLSFIPYAVGWRQTTVSKNPWCVRVGEDDERPYDLGCDDSGHWFLFAEEED